MGTKKKDPRELLEAETAVGLPRRGGSLSRAGTQRVSRCVYEPAVWGKHWGGHRGDRERHTVHAGMEKKKKEVFHGHSLKHQALCYICQVSSHLIFSTILYCADYKSFHFLGLSFLFSLFKKD